MAGRRSPTTRVATPSSRPTRRVLASSDSPDALESRGPTPVEGSGLDAATRPRDAGRRGPRRLLAPKNVFLWPALLVVLALSIFPLIVSLYLSFSRLQFTAAGIDIRFLGINNYQSLLFGSEQTHVVGLLKPPSLIGWAIFLGATVLIGWGFVRAVRGRVRRLGLIFRTIGGALGIGLTWLLVSSTFSAGGRPGTLFVTLSYVFVGLTFQYA